MPNFFQTLMKPDREDPGNADQSDVARAANILMIGEFQMLQLAYFEWYGEDLPIALIDRLFAARAALELGDEACLVVDAGTALTVDVARPATAGAARGAFLGGAIAPGPTLLAAALARGAAQLPEIDPQPGAAALGLDTRAAIESGIAVGFAGA